MSSTLSATGREAMDSDAKRGVLSRIFPWLVLAIVLAMTIAPIFSLVIGSFVLFSAVLAYVSWEYTKDHKGDQ